MRSDRLIKIAIGASRRSKQWKNKELKWSEFVDHLRIPTESIETVEEFKAKPKEEKDDLKDVGGFVGGALSGNQRLARFVVFRDLITLDADNIPSHGVEDIVESVRSLQMPALIYSTRNHIPTSPRLRIIIPLAKSCTPDEYEPIARKIASWIDPSMEIFDKTTFDVSRMMYYPSVCKGAEYIHEEIYPEGEEGFCEAKNVLSDYSNWTDVTQWPAHPDTEVRKKNLAESRQDPCKAAGIVGQFCTLYNIHTVIEEFLQDYYEPCGDRYTYKQATTTAGAVVYREGAFLYSNHASDPACGQLCNAFDLVRIHRFGSLDDTADLSMPTHKLPSSKAMIDFCHEIPEVRTLKVRTAFTKQAPEEAVNLDFVDSLEIDPKSNKILPTVDNFLQILEHDPLIKGKMEYNEMDGREWVTGIMPWEKPKFFRKRTFTDGDAASLRHYIEITYDVYNHKKTNDAFDAYMMKHKVHPVRDYLESLEWDGTERLDKILIDYFGCEDNIYTREAGRKALTGAVARIYEPGCKFDYMLLIAGKQGMGKTSFFKKLGGEWFAENLRKFNGKEACEQIQGKWIVESGELAGFNKSSMEEVKAFISAQTDVYRGAYLKYTDTRPRQCILVGTTNHTHFLRDITGERRFWPIDAVEENAKLDIFTDLDINRDQLWAEAKYRYQQGELLFLQGESKKLAEYAQEEHKEFNAKTGIIEEFLSKKIPERNEWISKDLRFRQAYCRGEYDQTYENKKLVERKFISAIEVYVECFNGIPGNMRPQDSREIISVIQKLPGWHKADGRTYIGKAYGTQRGFERL